MTQKTYVLDTSALVSNPTVYINFKDSTVVIPIVVLSELDKLKKESNEAGKNARVAIKHLDKITSNLKENDSLNKGILLEDNILLKIDIYYNTDKSFGDLSYGDTQILACAVCLFNEQNHKDLILVSNDFNLRIKAKSYGLEAISFEKSKREESELFTGIQVWEDPISGNVLLKDRELVDDELNEVLSPNEFIQFVVGDKEVALGRKVNDKIIAVKKYTPWGISSRNKEQTCAIDLLMDKKVDFVSIAGTAGCGKTFITLASVFELVLNKRMYDKLIIYRAIQPVGQDIGYLVGGKEEKIQPWFEAIYDNIEVLFNSSNRKGDWKRELEMFQKKGLIELDILLHIRGRSISNSIMWIDDCQNLTTEDAKTILTRVGEGTKVIFTADPGQIDNNKLDCINNAMTFALNKFKNSSLSGHITLIEGQRSALATEATNLM